MKLWDLVSAYRPESWGRNEDWPQHARRLWTQERAYMRALMKHMRRVDSWFYKAVTVNDGVVQDGHHRIVVALCLGWYDREIPLAHV